jgi:hypothetical protein
VKLIKALFKLIFIALIGGAIAAAVKLLKKSSRSTEVSHESWPDVPRKSN